MNELYKYWFYYIKPEYLHLVNTESDDSLLYAYTDNKELSDIFKSQRDMSKFFVVKREIDRSEVNYLAKYFSREYLIKKEIKTKSKGIGSTIIDYNLVITSTEFNLIQSASSKIIILDLWTRAWTSPYIFNNKYLEAFDKIGYKWRYDTLNAGKENNKNIDKMGENIQPDLLSTFIREFGFLLVSKKGNE